MSTVYSVVDIETTGGRSSFHKIIEIAIYKYDGEKIIDEYQTLINPEASIPYGISRLTGITNAMVVDSPKFYEVAKEIYLFMENTTFVAHNVFFDYNFIKKEFSELGFSFQMPKLCTVRMARKALPGHKSYSLGNICRDLAIPISDRHRAAGDARATVTLLEKILAAKSDIALETIVSSHNLTLPQGLSPDKVNELPESVGVYYFRDDSGAIIYVGKSNNIKKRVKSHFSPNFKSQRDHYFKSIVADIDYLLVPDKAVVSIVEACEIKKLRPKMNRQFNRVKFRYHLSLVKEKGFLTFKIKTGDKLGSNQALRYRSRKVCENAIKRAYRETFGLEHQGQALELFQKTLGPEHFNQKLAQWKTSREYPFVDTDGEIALNKNVTLYFTQGELTKLVVADHQFSVKEDPDIKRMTLRILEQVKDVKKKLKVSDEGLSASDHLEVDFGIDTFTID